MRFVFVALVALALCLSPVTHVLGYEASYGALLFFVAFGAVLFAQRSPAEHALALALPLVALIVNALRVKNCNIAEGAEWYIVHTLPQALFAFVLVHALLDRFGKKRGLALYVGILVVTAGSVITSVLVGPSMRAYSVLAGFFAGSIYDESLPIPHALYWHQLMTLLYAYALYAWRFADAGRAALLSLVVAIGIDASGSRLGFEVHKSDLHEALSRTVATDHLVLHFAPGGAIERQIGDVWPEAERAAQLIAEKIAGTDQTIAQQLVAEPTHVFIYESAELKERLLGAKYTNFARPSTREVHVLASDIQMPSLAHELVHSFARLWSDNPFGVPFSVVPNMGLVEGVAVALAEDRDSVLFESMAALQSLGKLPNLRTLLGVGFYVDSGARAYTATGAFCAWLAQTRGIALLKKAYQRGSLEAAVDEPLGELIDAYEAFLKTQPVDPLTARNYAEQFKERALYARVCGREFAQRKARAAQLVESGRFDDAGEIYEHMRADDPGDASIALLSLDLDRRRAMRSPSASARFETEATKLIASDVSSPTRARLQEQLADRLVAREAVAEAGPLYASALTQMTRAEDVRRLQLKQALLSRNDASSVIGALDGSLDAQRALTSLEEAFHRTPDDPIIGYLLTRRFMMNGDFARAWRYGTNTAADRLPQAARFEHTRLLFDCAIRLRAAADYATFTDAMRKYARSPLEQRAVAESLERARFYEQHQTW
jgi:hypothetical protein